MEQQKKKVRVLFELGEALRTWADWPDYKQYGFGHEDVEDLLGLLTDLSLHGAPAGSNEVWVPLHAWRALGQLGDPRAIEPLIGMFDALCNDDWALEELPQALGMIGKTAISHLTAFLNDNSHSEFARGMAIGALEEIAKRDPSTRNDVVGIITHYLDDPDPKATGLNGTAVNALITLEARESIETLRRLYKSGTVDLFACGDVEDVEIELGLRTQRSSPRPDLAQVYGLTKQDDAKRQKIGRNDPCPCGSGKKYKKCCLH
jgi:HEAT repeat protein